MKKLLLILRSRRGDLLVDSMVGAVVVGIIIAVTAGTLVIMGKTSVNNSQNTARTIMLNNAISDQLPQAGALTGAPVITQAKVLDKTVDIAVWKKTDPAAGITTVYARTAKANNTAPEECRSAESAATGGCLLVSTRLTDDVGGMSVAAIKLINGSGSVKLKTETKVQPEVGEVRYVFKVTDSPAGTSSSLTFTSDATGTEFTVPIPAGKTGYFYGSLELPETATNISLTPSGPVKFDDTSFLMYGAPNE